MMAIVNGYATLSEFTTRYIPDAASGTVTAQTTQIEQIIQAISRKIDEETSSQFYATSAGVVRYFNAEYPCKLFIDDVKTITAVAVDADNDGVYETTVASTDYLLMPANHLPYQWIELAPWSASLGRWPTYPKSIKITGTWGNDQTWATDIVREACLIQAFRLYKRAGAPFGVMGGGEFGTATALPGLDPDVIELLRPVSRRVWWG
jgi:hypothetical protein